MGLYPDPGRPNTSPSKQNLDSSSPPPRRSLSLILSFDSLSRVPSAVGAALRLQAAARAPALLAAAQGSGAASASKPPRRAPALPPPPSRRPALRLQAAAQGSDAASASKPPPRPPGPGLLAGRPPSSSSKQPPCRIGVVPARCRQLVEEEAVPARCRRSSILVWAPCCQRRCDHHLRLKTAQANPLQLQMKVSEVGVSTSSSSAGQNEDPNQVIVSGVGGDTRNQEEGQHTLSTEEILALDDDDPEKEEVAGSTGKRKKRCTSVVWQYFTKKTVVVEVDGKKYEQLWGYCNFPRCKQRRWIFARLKQAN
ncbi:hypothetical protein E2562_021912 [Oryza meyeriana var. granulata]|uniref:Uncharacterized protein n=1 Tax=Oryza meyeriana var. granulata TaxID=110450 RepID=A0A6G1C8M1_9ORYZ|nr:hypothetical protein E2562_021912 [Oryza meyeriana var. granulata]